MECSDLLQGEDDSDLHPEEGLNIPWTRSLTFVSLAP